jgi:hypothetical protein
MNDLKKDINNRDSRIIFICSSDNIFLSVKNLREDNRFVFSQDWAKYLVGSVFVFATILSACQHNSWSALGCCLVFGTTALCIIFTCMYEHFGKICLKLNAHGIFIVWNIFLPIKKYSIPFEDIGNFKIIEKSSAVSGHWHELVVETSDVLLPIIESNDCNFLCDLEQQLNNLLIILRSDRAESSNTLNNTIHENIILSISKNDSDKNCYSNTNIPTGTEWNFEQKKEQYIWHRNGNFDLYSFAINLLFGIWLLGGVLLLTRYFSYSAITITNIMLLFFLTFGLLFILGAFLMLISKFYHEKLIYNMGILYITEKHYLI